MAQLPQQRTFDVGTFYDALGSAMVSTGDFIAAKRKGNISKGFQERLMLAVTHVNGCRYCSYFHTYLALKDGMSKEEIQRILDGEFDHAPEEEGIALLFAQHYAETGGNYDADAYQRLVDVYGEQGAKSIVAAIRMIMVGNMQGLMFDALQWRLRGKPVADSKLWDEFAVAFGMVAFVPEIMTRRALSRLFGKRGTSPQEST